MRRGRKADTVELKTKTEQDVADFIFRKKGNHLPKALVNAFDVNFHTSKLPAGEKPVEVLHFDAIEGKHRVKKELIAQFFENVATEIANGGRLETAMIQKIAKISAKGAIFEPAGLQAPEGEYEAPAQGTPKPKTPGKTSFALDPKDPEIQRVAQTFFFKPRTGGKAAVERVSYGMHARFELQHENPADTTSPITEVKVAANDEKFVEPAKTLVRNILEEGLRLSALGLREYLTTSNVDTLIQRARPEGANKSQKVITPVFKSRTGGKKREVYVEGRTDEQKAALEIIDKSDLAFIEAPAGSGKTHLATGVGFERLRNNNKLLVLSRSVQTTEGEEIGFLPGEMKDKMAPFLQPIYEILAKMASFEEVEDMIEKRQIIIAPLAYIRGSTYENATVILDEAQNTRTKHIGDLLGRLGHGSKMILTGDPVQSDLPRHLQGGFELWRDRMAGKPGVGVVKLSLASNQRHPLVAAAASIMQDIRDEEQRRETEAASRFKYSDKQLMQIFRSVVNMLEENGPPLREPAADRPQGPKR